MDERIRHHLRKLIWIAWKRRKTEGKESDQTRSGSRDRLEKFDEWQRCMVELGSSSHEPDHQEPPFCQIRVVFSPLYGDLLMKRPLRNRTVGAVRGTGNPTLYSMYTQQCVPIGA